MILISNTKKIIPIIVFFILFFSGVVWPESNQENSIRQALKKKINSIGVCSSLTGKINLDELLFIKNNSIKIPNKNGYNIFSIENENVRTETFDKSGVLVESTKFDLEMEINIHNKKEDNLDLELSFLLLDKNLSVYWKETYKHQLYRLGIFEIKNNELIWKCEGRGGSYRSH